MNNAEKIVFALIALAINAAAEGFSLPQV